MDDDDFGWKEIGDELPNLETVEGRDEWIEILADQDIDDERVARVILVYDEKGHMLARVRYVDGSEEVFDMTIQRQFELVKPTSERENN